MNPLPSRRLWAASQSSQSVCELRLQAMEPVGQVLLGRGVIAPGAPPSYHKAVWGVELEGWTLLDREGHPWHSSMSTQAQRICPSPCRHEVVTFTSFSV